MGPTLTKADSTGNPAPLEPVEKMWNKRPALGKSAPQ